MLGYAANTALPYGVTLGHREFQLHCNPGPFSYIMPIADENDLTQYITVQSDSESERFTAVDEMAHRRALRTINFSRELLRVSWLYTVLV